LAPCNHGTTSKRERLLDLSHTESRSRLLLGLRHHRGYQTLTVDREQLSGLEVGSHALDELGARERPVRHHQELEKLTMVFDLSRRRLDLTEVGFSMRFVICKRIVAHIVAKDARFAVASGDRDIQLLFDLIHCG
jgi:hypothetical protein